MGKALRTFVATAIFVLAMSAALAQDGIEAVGSPWDVNGGIQGFKLTPYVDAIHLQMVSGAAFASPGMGDFSPAGWSASVSDGGKTVIAGGQGTFDSFFDVFFDIHLPDPVPPVFDLDAQSGGQQVLAVRLTWNRNDNSWHVSPEESSLALLLPGLLPLALVARRKMRKA